MASSETNASLSLRTRQHHNWCPTCMEECRDHATVCTVCGTTLQSTALSREIEDAFELQAQLGTMISNLRTQIESVQAAAGALAGVLPPEAMDPSVAAPKSRPTSKGFLDSIQRVHLEATTSIFHKADVQLVSCDDKSVKFHFVATPGEFGLSPPHDIRGTLLIAKPITGKGGLDAFTKSQITKIVTAGHKCILYMDRGGDLTFAKKALMAQDVGASALIVGNTLPVWPYTMKDSKGESAKGCLRIPTVMIKMEDAVKLILAGSKRNDKEELHLQVSGSIKEECAVCRDEFELGQDILQLPPCGHIFHEKCALLWLKQHNTCPYCRRELPTDDEAYEEERRRQARTHTGPSVATADETDGQYDSIFG